MIDFMKANREAWDGFVGVHVGSKFYDVEGFENGRCTLLDIEREEVGDVKGKSLLHLQCHFGLDTLSWARLGAQVTGMDYSEKAIAAAISLSKELNIPAEFVCCNLYELPKRLNGEFDVVFTSAGVLTWLPDLRKWGEVIAQFLKPGGIFYIREYHPVLCMFDDENKIPTINDQYFHTQEPRRYESEGSYADLTADVHSVTYEWAHGLGEVVNALIGAGLQIEYLHEFNYVEYQARPFLKRDSEGRWVFPDPPGGVPMMFSIRAVKD